MRADLALDRPNPVEQRRVGFQLQEERGVEGGARIGRLLRRKLEGAPSRGRAYLDRTRRRGEEARDLVRVADGGGQTDTTDAAARERVQSLERDPELGAPVGTDELVDLVHDDGPHVRDRLPEEFPDEEELERLRGRE